MAIKTTNKPVAINVPMDDEQKAKLQAESKRLKISMALVIRQFIDSLPTPPSE
jgi:hypothetical protein